MNPYYLKKVFKTENVFAFLLIGVFLFTINTFSNSITTLHFNQNHSRQQTTVKEAFVSIEKKTSYHFFYSNELQDLNAKVKLNTIDKNIKNTLTKPLWTTSP